MHTLGRTHVNTEAEIREMLELRNHRDCEESPEAGKSPGAELCPTPPHPQCLEGTSHADPFLSQLWPPELAEKRLLWFELCSLRSHGPATPGSQCGVISATEQEIQPRGAARKTGGWRTGQPATCRLRHTRGGAGGGPDFSVKSPQAPHSCGLCGKAKLGGSSSHGKDPQGDGPKKARAGCCGAESPASRHALYVPHTPLQQGKPRVQGSPAWEPRDLWHRNLS